MSLLLWASSLWSASAITESPTPTPTYPPPTSFTTCNSCSNTRYTWCGGPKGGTNQTCVSSYLLCENRLCYAFYPSDCLTYGSQICGISSFSPTPSPSRTPTPTFPPPNSFTTCQSCISSPYAWCGGPIGTSRSQTCVSSSSLCGDPTCYANSYYQDCSTFGSTTCTPRPVTFNQFKQGLNVPEAQAVRTTNILVSSSKATFNL